MCPAGDIIDAGAFKGTSTIQFAHLLEIYRRPSLTKVIAFDTFEDHFPHARPDEVAPTERHMTVYDPTSYERLTSAVSELGLDHRIEIVVGDIVETLPAYLAERRGVRLLHCDLDVYKPTLVTLNAVWPRLVPGGIVIFDEYAVAEWGEFDAIDEFLASLDVLPELRVIPHSANPTCYCVKSTT